MSITLTNITNYVLGLINEISPNAVIVDEEINAVVSNILPTTVKDFALIYPVPAEQIIVRYFFF
ncbi:hypothetical protein FACS1894153_4200 [Bacteroidia bacterium]|nr:hypothetical protein FACS1894153_4200 [Bacteroidia bacterium]